MMFLHTHKKIFLYNYNIGGNQKLATIKNNKLNYQKMIQDKNMKFVFNLFTNFSDEFLFNCNFRYYEDEY